MKQLLLIGPPGSGKGTHAQGLATRHHAVHLSTGDLFRAQITQQTALGKQLASYLAEGALVPDDMVIAAVEAALAALKDQYAWVILDGFPRTVPQATALAPLQAQDDWAVLSFTVPQTVLVERLLGRGRADDTADTITKRLGVYAAETEVLLAHYAELGRLHRVEGTGTVEEVTARTEEMITTLGW